MYKQVLYVIQVVE